MEETLTKQVSLSSPWSLGVYNFASCSSHVIIPALSSRITPGPTLIPQRELPPVSGSRPVPPASWSFWGCKWEWYGSMIQIRDFCPLKLCLCILEIPNLEPFAGASDKGRTKAWRLKWWGFCPSGVDKYRPLQPISPKKKRRKQLEQQRLAEVCK